MTSSDLPAFWWTRPASKARRGVAVKPGGPAPCFLQAGSGAFFLSDNPAKNLGISEQPIDGA
jgi:hypothetical protein